MLAAFTCIADLLGTKGDELICAAHAGWLDARIAARVRPERPPWHLTVVCGASCHASQASNEHSMHVLVAEPTGRVLLPARLRETLTRL